MIQKDLMYTIYSAIIWKGDNGFSWKMEERQYTNFEAVAKTNVYKYPEQVHAYKNHSEEYGNHLLLMAWDSHTLECFFNGMLYFYRVQLNWDEWFEGWNKESAQWCNTVGPEYVPKISEDTPDKDPSVS